MKRLAGLLSVVVALTASNAINGQEKTDQKSPDLVQLRKDISELRDLLKDQGTIITNQKKLADKVEDLEKRLEKLDQFAKTVSPVIRESSDILKEIAKKDSSGRWAPDLLSSMANPEFKQGIEQMIARSGGSARLRIYNPYSFDQYLYVNGVQWRFLPNTEHYVPVTPGRVVIAREPELPLVETVQEPNSRVLNIQLGFPPLR